MTASTSIYRFVKNARREGSVVVVYHSFLLLYQTSLLFLSMDSHTHRQRENHRQPIGINYSKRYGFLGCMEAARASHKILPCHMMEHPITKKHGSRMEKHSSLCCVWIGKMWNLPVRILMRVFLAEYCECV